MRIIKLFNLPIGHVLRLLSLIVALGVVLLYQYSKVIITATTTTSFTSTIHSNNHNNATMQTAHKQQQHQQQQQQQEQRELDLLSQYLQPDISQLPNWFIEYAKWHSQEIEQLSLHKNWSSQQSTNKYLLQICLLSDVQCGGTADRLKSIPTKIKMAAQTRRIFFILWERPYRLEEFLIPPNNKNNDNSQVPLFHQTINWTVPEWLLPFLYPHFNSTQQQLLMNHYEPKSATSFYNAITTTTATTTTTMHQNFSQMPVVVIRDCFGKQGGAEWYDTTTYLDNNDNGIMITTNNDNTTVLRNKNNNNNSSSSSINNTLRTTTFEQEYSNVWAALFQPSLAVLSELQYQLSILQLQPKQYDALHIRSQYLSNEVVDNRDMIINATNCALFGHDGQPLPLFVATDSNEATEIAIVHAQHQRQIISSGHHSHISKVVSSSPRIHNENNNNPIILHLDRGSVFLARDNRDEIRNHNPPSDYYSTFVDLYLLSMARCITYGRGGYGLWASMISSPSSLPASLSLSSSASSSTSNTFSERNQEAKCSLSYFYQRHYNFSDRCIDSSSRVPEVNNTY